MLTQVPDRATAVNLATALVGSRIAACVSIGTPVESLYHWQRRIETASEIPVVIKAPVANYPEVEALIRANHPYELPEILAVPITHGLPAYLQWVATEAYGVRG